MCLLAKPACTNTLVLGQNSMHALQLQAVHVTHEQVIHRLSQNMHAQTFSLTGNSTQRFR